MINLPVAFEKRMTSFPGFDIEAYKNEINNAPVKGFRVNTDKITRDEFDKINIFGNKQIPFVENGYYLDYEKIGNHPFHHAGMVYVQEPAAMAPAECIDIDPSWTVLDMCAAPGGKSTQLRNKLGKNGILVSNEIISSRCRILTGNIERMGAHNTVTTCMDTKKLAGIFHQTFDLIMCDAPCSGEGMFRKDETAISEWSEQNVLMCAQRQREILENAVGMLKNNGYIIYATCTFSVEENEMVIDSFLSSHPEFELTEVKDSVIQHTTEGILFDGCKNKTLNLTRRFYPYISKGEGQFMAVLHNKNREITTDSRAEKKAVTDKTVLQFLDDTLTVYNSGEISLYNNKPVIFSPCFPIKDGIAFSCGITIGEIKKNYILPHHQFFMAEGKNFRRKIELEAHSVELRKYLHGDEITADCENGWGVVTVNGCSVGGIKIVNGVGKNHYPKGLRTKNL